MINISLSNIFKSEAMKNKHHLGVIPFTTDKIGDFIYLCNRPSGRYSYLYDRLEELEVYNNCTISMGYASLLICTTIEYLESTGDRVPLEIRNQECKGTLKDKYCIFQHPLTKKNTDSFDDIVETFDKRIMAVDFARELHKSKNASLLVARVKEHISWH